ncbi:MAG: D-alanine--D-alanine ligase [Clostridia bacterium]|nr:D-alanine--D-alanine ligase [Clostridia bacterium]
MKTKLAVLFGGKSVEHEISVISALQAIENLNRDKYDIIPVYISKSGDMYTGEILLCSESYRDIPEMLKKSTKVTFASDGGKAYLVRCPAKKFGSNTISEVDVAFPIVHGTNVEDGVLQGYLKTVGLPFVGCDVLASAVGMDKYVMKAMLRDGGFPVLDSLRFSGKNQKKNEITKAVEKKFSYPVIVKPVNLGSSVGITVAHDRDSLEKALGEALNYADTIIVERAIVNLREINCSVVGDASHAEASECEEPFMCDEILSYEDKYMSGGKGGKSGGSKGMASLKRKVPADISPELREKIRKMAVDSFRWLGCCGVSRIDFMIDADTDELFINEFNTIPGSLSFYLWKPLGVSYTELLDKLISLAFKRQREASEITFSFDTNILAMGAPTGAKGAKGAKL